MADNFPYPFYLSSPAYRSDTARQRRYLEEQENERRRQAEMAREENALLTLEQDRADQEQYALDVFASDQAARQTADAIRLGRDGAMDAAVDPRTNIPPIEGPSRFVEYSPILTVEEEVDDEIPASSPLAYVTTGEIYSDPTAPPAPTSTSTGSNKFWDFLGLSEKNDRQRWGNSMLRAGGAMLAANTPSWSEALGRGITAYADGSDAYDETQRKNSIQDQQIALNQEKIASAKRVEAVQGQIAKIIADAGPGGLSAVQRQQIANLYASIGDTAGTQAALSGTTGTSTADMQEYEYYSNQEVANGRTPMSFGDWQTKKTSGSGKSTDLTVNLDRHNQERISRGLQPLSMEEYQQEQNRAGADQKFSEKAGEEQAKGFAENAATGMAAGQKLVQLDVLADALKNNPGGMWQGAKGWAQQWGINIGEDASQIQVAQAILNQLTPQQRPAGSGAMSDADLAMFKASLPSLMGTPEGNQIILETMRAMALYQQQAGSISQRALNGEITRQDAVRMINEIPDPMTDFKSRRAAIQGAKDNANAPLRRR